MLKSATLFCYPWDFRDEGIDDLAQRARDLGITHLAVASGYHAGYFLYPHNPGRKVHLLEDGVVYFQPDERCYADGPIRPVVTTMGPQRDWIGAIGAAAGRAGLKMIAWTVLLHNTRIGLAHPEATIHNAFGDSYPHALSPAHPASVALARGLVRDLSAHYPVESILLEAPNYRSRAHGGTWVSGHHHERTGTHLRPLEGRLMDLSFNDADVEQAEAAGIDVGALRTAVRAHLTRHFDEAPDIADDLPATIEQFQDRHPALVAYEGQLRRAEQALLVKLKADARAHDVKLIGPAHPAIDIVSTGAYGEPIDGIGRITRAARVALQPQQDLMVVLRMGFYGPGMGQAILSEGQMVDATHAVAEHGADMIGYYNYAEAPLRCVNWIKPALASGVMAPDGAA